MIWLICLDNWTRALTDWWAVTVSIRPLEQSCFSPTEIRWTIYETGNGTKQTEFQFSFLPCRHANTTVSDRVNLVGCSRSTALHHPCCMSGTLIIWFQFAAATQRCIFIEPEERANSDIKREREKKGRSSSIVCRRTGTYLGHDLIVAFDSHDRMDEATRQRSGRQCIWIRGSRSQSAVGTIAKTG